jgi:ABC-type dipeptide/oligopeptide/nickel transport system permease component
MLAQRIARHGLTIVATVLLGGLLSATLVRFAPGFDTDEAQLDPHLNSESIQALQKARLDQHNIFLFYSHALQRAAHGDFGTSLSLGQPVGLLLRQRVPLTLELVGVGWLLSWTAVLALALSAAWLVHPGSGACVAFGPLERSRSDRHRAHHLPAGLSLCAQPACEGLYTDSHRYGPGKRIG